MARQNKQRKTHGAWQALKQGRRERRSTLAAQKKKWEGEDDGAAAGKIQGRHEGVVEKVRTQGLATPGLGVATRPVIGGGNGGQGPAEMPGAGWAG